MRRLTVLARELVRKPPLVFPFIALFHLVLLWYTVGGVITDPDLAVSWTEAAWMLGFSTLWIASCDLRKWAAIVYVVLSAATILLRFAIPCTELYSSALTLPSALFSFLLLFYFPRFSQASGPRA